MKRLILRSIWAIILATLCAAAAARPAAADWSEDMRSAVFSRIEADPSINGYELDVEARNHTIWLRGHVANQADKEKIVEIARHLTGVQEVRDELTLLPVTEAASPQLARAVEARIMPLSSSAGHAVTITTHGSVVVISGVVSSEAGRRKIDEAARSTPGVTQVVDNITVTRPPDSEIAAKIRSAIAESGEIKIDRLNVEVANGVATLSGIGKSHRDNDHALALALMVDGVEDVHSNLSLERPYHWDPSRDR